MILSLLLTVLITLSGALITYVYDRRTSVAVRLCTGACLGFGAFGLIAFIFASLLGLTPFAIGFATLLTLIPFLLMLDDNRRNEVRNDLTATAHDLQQRLLHPQASDIGYAAFYIVVVILTLLVFGRAMIVKPEGIFTGVLNDFG